MTDAPLLPPALAEALNARGYESLTQVQSAVLEPETTGRDLLVSAQTGSGKTVGFGLAMAADLLDGADRLGPADAPMAIIVAPTRELAQQVSRELTWLYAQAGGKIATCVGGMDPREERRALARGAHIVVGTPGRLSDHIRRGNLLTSFVKVVVLDEADEMLDMGFREELEHILEGTPETRRSLLFSATVPKGIASLARKFQNDALRITTAAEKEQHIDIDYRALLVAPGDEENAIVNIIRHSDSESALVFCSTRNAVNHMLSRLNNRGFTVVSLSGELSQKERGNALAALRSGRARVCVATDVAARGLDLPNLDLVVHAEMPRDPQTLKHRSGRTGRAGRKGTSAMLVVPRARRRVERLLKDAKIEATWGKPPSADEINALDDARLLKAEQFTDPATESEAALAAKLIEAHGETAVAAAFVKLYRAGRSAPEDLRDVDDRPPRKDKRDRNERFEKNDRFDRNERGNRRERPERGPRETPPGFENARWVQLTVGRRKNAEARWILPLLCNSGKLSKSDIGAIRVNMNDTHIELKPGAVEKLMGALDDNGCLEKSLRVNELDGVPQQEAYDPRSSAPSQHGKPFRKQGGGSKPPFKGKSGDKPRYDKRKSEDRSERTSWSSDEAKPRKKDRHRNRPKVADASSNEGGERPYVKGKKKPYIKGPKTGAPSKAKLVKKSKKKPHTD
ncbi:MAG: DEAD/DEAH box helicase [Hyphomonas sp.]